MEYRFDSFRLDATTRELRHDDALVALPARAFDGLAYLIRHRARAVGRDEFVSAVWGRVDVTDAQVNQLMLRIRRALGDDGQAQRAVRTVPGFGYRWVLDTVEIESAPAAEPRVPESPPSVPSAGTSTRPRRRLPTFAVAALAVALALTGFAAYRLLRVEREAPQAATAAAPASAPASAPIAADTVAVLPLAIDGPREAGWLRLGAMELVADRMRNVGLPVVLSESVITSTRGAASPPTPADLDRIGRTLGVGLVVRGSATLASRVWTVRLAVTDPRGVRHEVSADHADATEAARRAADLLLAAFGRPQTAPLPEASELDERLQQAQAALLAGEPDAARALLTGAEDQDDPRVRLKLAQVDFRAGRVDEAERALTALLDDPRVRGDATQRGVALTARGDIRYRRADFAGAEGDYDAAVKVLADLRDRPEYAKALNGRGISRVAGGNLDAAADDLGAARAMYQRLGERLGLAQVDGNLGLLEWARGHLDLGHTYLAGAAERFEAFGAVERLVSVRAGMLDLEMEMLRWNDALATSERLWALRDRAGDPGLALLIGTERALVFAALGRYREAEALLADLRVAHAGVRPQALRYWHAARADLAWRRGRAQDAADEAEAALDVWPPHSAPKLRARAVIVRQRASIAAGNVDVAAIEAELARDNVDSSAVLLLARAEWAAHRGRDADAERDYRAALALAQRQALPAQTVLVVAGYVDRLLAQRRADDAAAVAGRIAPCVDTDYDCALVQLAVLDAAGRPAAWTVALDRAKALAGERTLPARLAMASQP
ncbi:winged helix-turn-helix domain-containing protein [Tahibacter soli]|uniref:Winged helix-turn-helix domain-containing protein n=1 Tax=Tahibacter soli TaxID=2983605 RepID=A0A9X3YPH6_9GAMM|nr:winged helix-turn-helix domain-containing protein [Tahibacter soli]MDC8014386.1 winged helix-turn-helix domain-containing protein [Tahibacter soli]